MLKKMIPAAAAVAMLAGAAQASHEFTVLGSIDASDNPAVQGAPITTDGTYYQEATFGTDNPPTAAFIELIGQSLAEDSYIALDGANFNGQAMASTVDYTANTATTALPTEFTANSLSINAAFSMPGTGITALVRPELAGGPVADNVAVVFFARLTVQGGSGGVDTPSVVVNVTDPDQDGVLIALDLSLGAVDDNGNITAIGYDGNTVSFGELGFFILNHQTAGEFGTINDLYVAYATIIPTPGAAGLLGLAGLAAARRRRR